MSEATKPPLSVRLRELSPCAWLTLLAAMSIFWGIVMALFMWPVASLVLSFVYLDWANAMTHPQGRAMIVITGLYFAAKAWGWTVDTRKDGEP